MILNPNVRWSLTLQFWDMLKKHDTHMLTAGDTRRQICIVHFSQARSRIIILYIIQWGWYIHENLANCTVIMAPETPIICKVQYANRITHHEDKRKRDSGPNEHGVSLIGTLLHSIFDHFTAADQMSWHEKQWVHPTMTSQQQDLNHVLLTNQVKIHWQVCGFS